MKIGYLELQKMTALHAEEIHAAVERVVDRGWYLLGEENRMFEEEYAQFIGSSCCVGCGNGLDALSLIFRAYIEQGVMQPGDEVIVPANTYIASILAVTENRLVPVLVEPDIHTFQIDDRRIEEAITPKTKAVMIVHLYGRLAYTPKIEELCRKYQLKLIEDNAQAHGLICPDGRRTGSLGDAAAHSFYPGKNLGALGDAGAVTTDDSTLAKTVRTLANYGSSKKYVFDYCGKNSRLDELQAAVLRVKLKYLEEENDRRKAVAKRFIEQISNRWVTLPDMETVSQSVFHIFPVRCKEREQLQQWLAEKGIGTMIHYPIPPHQQKCYHHWDKLILPITETIHREELSLPCNQLLSDEEVTYIIDAVNSFSL